MMRHFGQINVHLFAGSLEPLLSSVVTVYGTLSSRTDKQTKAAAAALCGCSFHLATHRCHCPTEAV